MNIVVMKWNIMIRYYKFVDPGNIGPYEKH